MADTLSKKWIRPTGFVLNIIAAILISLFAYYYLPYVFHLNVTSLPAWTQ